jgi:osmotically-inducible protein OsmY
MANRYRLHGDELPELIPALARPIKHNRRHLDCTISWWPSNFEQGEPTLMKSNRFFATAALLGAISFAMPMYAHAQDNSMEGGAKEMYHGAKTDVRDAGITTKIKGALDTNPITKSSTIHVDTNDGVVNLTGEVRSAKVMLAAQKIAQNTEHVKSVSNNLTVAAPVNASGM